MVFKRRVLGISFVLMAALILSFGVKSLGTLTTSLSYNP